MRIVKLSERPDGYGFFYGHAEKDGQTVNVNILPPKEKWDGDTKLEGFEPEPGQWIVYADGEEIARLERLEIGGLITLQG